MIPVQFRRQPLVYVIGGEALIKIGCTCDLESRLETLRAASPVALRFIAAHLTSTKKAAHELEAQLHTRFIDARVHHEWFRVDEDEVVAAFPVTEMAATDDDQEPWCRDIVAADHLGVTLSEFRRLVREGKVPATRTGPRTTLFKRSRIMAAFLLLTACGGTPKPPMPLVKAVRAVAVRVASDLCSALPLHSQSDPFETTGR